MKIQNPEIVVFDSIMGSGKSSYFIQSAKYQIKKPTIIVAYYESEVVRYSDALENFHVPDKTDGNYRNKTDAALALVNQGKSLIITHALLQRIAYRWEEFTKLKELEYHIVIDEVPQAIEHIRADQRDLRMLERDGVLAYRKDDEFTQIDWLDESYTGELQHLKKRLCGHNTIVHNDQCIRIIPKELLCLFDKIWVGTYMFDESWFRCLLDVYQLPYVKRIIASHKKVYIPLFYRPQYGSKHAQLVNVYDHKARNTKWDDNSLSLNCFKSMSKAELGEFSKTIHSMLSKKGNNFDKEGFMFGVFDDQLDGTKIRSNIETPRFIWTKKKANMTDAEKQQQQTFVPVNCKGTNMYSDRYSLAYLVKRHLNPTLKNFVGSYGVKIDQNRFALAEMLQWIWRSRIRKGLDIWVFIASTTLRKLFYKWLSEQDGQVEQAANDIAYEEEKWIAVDGYEGIYEVSNLGNVRSLDREIAVTKGGTRRLSGANLNPCTGDGGYVRCVLHKDGGSKTVYVHQLVARAFCSGEESGKDVNHINARKHDNRASNLEWVTPSENCLHRERMKRLWEMYKDVKVVRIA